MNDIDIETAEIVLACEDPQYHGRLAAYGLDDSFDWECVLTTMGIRVTDSDMSKPFRVKRYYEKQGLAMLPFITQSQAERWEKLQELCKRDNFYAFKLRN